MTALLSGRRWQGRELLRVAFPTSVDDYPRPWVRARGYKVAFEADFAQVPETLRQAHLLGFARWREAGAPRVVETRDPRKADILVGLSGVVREWGYGFFPGRGEIWHNPDIARGDFAEGTRLFCHVLHEQGHGLGLDHLPAALGGDPFRSVMATGWPDFDRFPAGPGPDDRAAMAELYGRGRRRG